MTYQIFAKAVEEEVCTEVPSDSATLAQCRTGDTNSGPFAAVEESSLLAVAKLTAQSRATLRVDSQLDSEVDDGKPAGRHAMLAIRTQRGVRVQGPCGKGRLFGASSAPPPMGPGTTARLPRRASPFSELESKSGSVGAAVTPVRRWDFIVQPLLSSHAPYGW